MNEKITELYVQANKYASDAGFKKYDKAGDVNWQWEDTVFEKFAELIVQECVRAVESNRKEPREGYNTYNMGTFEAVDSIKQYFGIKE